MEKMVRKVVKTGFGLGVLSLEQAKKVVGKIQKEMNLNKKESVALAKELVVRSQKASDSVMRVASKQLDDAILKTGLVKKRELYKTKKVLKKRAKAKVAEIKKKVNKSTRGKPEKIKSKVKSKIKSNLKKAKRKITGKK